VIKAWVDQWFKRSVVERGAEQLTLQILCGVKDWGVLAVVSGCA
jgi:hypothetical protein